MKGFVLLVCFGLLTGSGLAQASVASHRAAAEHLLTVAHAKETMGKAIDRVVDIQIRQNPGLAPFHDVMLKFTRKYMGYDSIKDQIVDMYVRAFTEQELNDIAAFYQTPTGRKAVRLMPQLMSEGMQVGLQRFRAHVGELRTMIQARAEELRKQADQKGKGIKPDH